MNILKLPIKDIQVLGNRQRQEFQQEAMDDLMDSIRDFGLLQPISVRIKAAANENEADRYILVAGERRLRNITRLYEEGYEIKFGGEMLKDVVPCVCVGEVDLLTAEEMELAENFKRRDLTWQEHAAATKRLHALRQAQAKERGEEHTITDTAEEITGARTGGKRDNIRTEILVADYLDDPDVAKAKTPKQALNILKKKEIIKQAQQVAENYQPKRESLHRLYNGNCLTIMRELIDSGERFSTILTDPPYGINAHQFDDSAGTALGMEHHYNDSPTHFRKLMEHFIPLTYEITEERAHMYLFCDIEHYLWLREKCQSVGWYVHRTPFVFYKMGAGRVPLPDIGAKRQYELILYAIKGNKHTNGIAPDVIVGRQDTTTPIYHGAQKNISVYENLLARSTRPLDKVLDCFCGSGTIFPAAQSYQCRATGIEISEEYHKIAMKRLKEADERQLEVPNYSISTNIK